MNEELNTVNAELREKVQDLEKANNDIANLMNSTEVATVFLDSSMEIRRFTPAAKNLFNLIPSDVGRPIGDLAMRFNDTDLQNDSTRVMDTLHVSSREVETHEGKWYIRRILPFRTQDKRVDGLVLTFSDVTDIKEKEKMILESEKEVKEQSQILSGILEHTHMMAVLLDSGFNFIWVNRAYAETCGKDPSFFPGKNHFGLYPNEENEEIFKKAVETGEPYFTTARPFEFPDQPERGVTYWDWSLVPLKDESGNISNLVFTLYEVTEQIRAKKDLEKSEKKYRDLVENANSAIIRWKVDGKIAYFNEYAEEFFGYKEEEVLGKEVSLLMPDTDSSGEDLTGLVRAVAENPENFKNNINENILRDGTRVWMAWTNKPVLDKNGEVIEILAVGSDITALKNTEIALEKAEREKSLVLENANEIIAYHDTDHNLIWANQAYLEATGKTLPQLQGKKCYHSWGLEEQCNDCPVSRAINSGEPQNAEMTPENQEHWPLAQGSWSVRAAPVRDENGNTIGAIEVAHDITEQKKVEEELRILAHFPEENPSPVLRCNNEGNVLYANTPAQNWLKTLGWQFEGYLPDSVHNLVEAAREKTSHIEREIASPEGGVFNIIAIRPSGEEYVNLYGTDVTERTKAETAIESSLKEKEILLKEIHHRVKNNMQIISSLVSLQADRLKESGGGEILRDISNRVRSMAMVHEKLYQSTDLANVNFAQYTENLLSYLWRSYHSESGKINLVKDLRTVSLSVDAAVPLGLIINELVSNVLKHAFKGRKDGTVAVTLNEDEGGKIVLSVRDNGIGLPAGFDREKPGTLGLRLIQMLAAQVHADVEINSENGTEFKLILGRKE